MNCQDIARILDEQEVDGLPAALQSEVQAHLAGCRDCARDWRIHARMAGARIPAVPAELRALYAAQVQRTGDVGARGRSRFFIIGTLAATAAAAAAMLAVQMTGPATPAAASAVSPQVESIIPRAPVERVVAVSGDEVAQPDPRAEITDQGSTTSTAGLRVMVLPPRHDSPDSAAKAAIEAFHSSLLQSLRNIPDVAVEVVGADLASDQTGHRVTVVSPQYTTLSSGQRMYRSGDGSGGWSGGGARDGVQQWAVEVMLTPATPETGEINALPGPFGRAVAVRLDIGINGLPRGGFCGGSGISIDLRRGGDFTEVGVICSSVDRIAAALIDTLRKRSSPIATDSAQFVSRLQDASTSATDRQRVWSELLNRVRQGGLVLDAAALEAITAYVGSLPPDQRAQGWLRLQGMKQPALIGLLLESLQHDGDEKVRLEALSTLIADYGTDVRVRAAIESVARQDASRFVRMAAQRTLSGDSQWHAYMSEMLADEALPATQRLAPAIYGMRSNADRAAYDTTLTILGSAEGTNQLLDIFQDLFSEVHAAGEDSRSVRSQEDAMLNVLSVLTSTNPSAAIELQMKVLEARLPNSLATGQALRALVEKRDDPRVGKLLDDIAAGNLGATLRNSLEMHMAQRHQTAPGSSAFQRPF